MFFLCLHHLYGSKCGVKIKELLELQFDNWRSENEELETRPRARFLIKIASLPILMDGLP